MIGIQIILNIAAEEMYHFAWEEITDTIILANGSEKLGMLLADYISAANEVKSYKNETTTFEKILSKGLQKANKYI